MDGSHCNKCNKDFHGAEATTGGVLQKKVFLKMSQNSQENIWAKISY